MAAGVMAIHYRSDNIPQAARSIANEFSDAWNRLNTINNRVLSIRENSGRNYLSNASYFIKLKRAQYEKKNEQALRFATRVDSFLGECKNTDARVATHIEQSYKFFKRVTGIGKSAIAAFFDKLWESAKDFIAKALFVVITLPLRIALAPFFVVIKIADVIVKFYNSLPEEWRYAIKAVWASIKVIFALIAVVTITATGFWGVIATIGALILLANATVGFVRSWLAYTYSKAGLSDDARKMDEMSNGELFGNAMGELGLDAKAWTTGYNITVFCGTIMYVAGSASTWISEAYKGGKYIGYWNSFKSKYMDEVFSFKLDIRDITSFGSQFINNTSWGTRLTVLDVGPAVSAVNSILGITETFVFKPIALSYDFASGKFDTGAIIDQFTDMFIYKGDKFNDIKKLGGEIVESW